MLEGEVEDEPVDTLGGHAGPNLAGEHVEAFGDQPAGPAHAFEGLGAVKLDLAGLALRRERRVRHSSCDRHRGEAALPRLMRCRNSRAM